VSQSSSLTRRELLKILAAASGAAALSTVPNQWKTPVVEVGALPAHAQGSLRGSINGFVNLANQGGARAQSRTSSPGAAPHLTLTGTAFGADGTLTNQTDFVYHILSLPGGDYTVHAAFPSGFGLFIRDPNDLAVHLDPGENKQNINFVYVWD
jgi:hypothetical protein